MESSSDDYRFFYMPANRYLIRQDEGTVTHFELVHCGISTATPYPYMRSVDLSLIYNLNDPSSLPLCLSRVPNRALPLNSAIKRIVIV
jgi:hypothetical protein